MNLQKIERIQFSLMKRESEIDKEGKAEYLRYETATFKTPKDFFKENDESILEGLVEAIFKDLSKKAQSDSDTLGIWIDYGSTTYENAISLSALRDIQEYSKTEISPIYEFFKMSLIE